MQTAMIVISIASASLAGTALGYWGLDAHEQGKIVRSYRVQAGTESDAEEKATFLLVGGIYRRIILLAIRYSLPTPQTQKQPSKFWLLRQKRMASMLRMAGLSGRVTQEACAIVRRNLSLALAGIGLLLGSLFSGLFALILCCLGFSLGYHALLAALEQEVGIRSTSVEKELSQLIEVLVLGLRSGLSFDRSLEFYCSYFSGGLSERCEHLQTQWQHGLITREEGLVRLAESYDSSLLERIMESIKRSLRFGTSLAETLSNAGNEIRKARKVKLEEKVAKAPVKMLIPIGTLILPAMLILILGPILLELIDGF